MHPMGFEAEKGQKILEKLNEVQKKAVLHEKGPLVVFAGAGSGKTRIITSRIAYLIEKGIRPAQILAVTFTNKAAREMKERVEHLTLNGQAVFIGTFHSACARWLREFAHYLGFQSDFSIYDDKDSNNALKIILKEFKIDLEKSSAPEYRNAISKAKVLGWSPIDAEKLVSSYENFFPELGIPVYRRYQEYLAACNAMDFSDLLMNMLSLLRNHKDVRERLQNRFRYVLVDEYQDTNPTQFALISLLLNKEKNLCVVGDDDQSIYSWRGADPANILEFKTHYPAAVEIRLEQNYRCTGNIIKAASAVIKKNQYRNQKALWTENAAGADILYDLSYDGEMESLSVIDSIVAERSEYSYEDIAVFYRTNAQSRQIEESLRRQNIPYRIYGALRFYDRAEIKDILAYFRLISNNQDDMAFQRVIGIPPRGIGKKAVEMVQERAKSDAISCLESAKRLVKEKVPRVGAKLELFLTEFEGIKNALMGKPLSEVLTILLSKIPYQAYLEKKFPDQASDKMANIHELGAALADYHESYPDVDLSGWLIDASLSGSEKEEHGGVCLMTLHSAKGLEFRRVYILGLEDGLLPHANSLDDEYGLEEERRLFYVGLTRACEKISLHAAKKRRIFNQWMVNDPSRFLKEIPKNLLNNKSQGQVKDRVYREMVVPIGMDVGSHVSHPTFGKGTIEELEDYSGKAIVNFIEVGKRKISLQHLKQIAFLS